MQIGLQAIVWHLQTFSSDNSMHLYCYFLCKGDQAIIYSVVENFQDLSSKEVGKDSNSLNVATFAHHEVFILLNFIHTWNSEL